MMKVMVVLGTRPEVIKMAPVIQALQEAQIETIVCATGQHREMLAQALAVFSITPDISLDVMVPGQSLNKLASKLLAELDEVIDRTRPDWVLVQGDTTTALCGALAAFHRGVNVGHVEAGLRTGDLSSPFPEEANRAMLARIATLHFAPTKKALEALQKESIDVKAICVTGNTVVDAIEMAKKMMNSALLFDDQVFERGFLDLVSPLVGETDQEAEGLLGREGKKLLQPPLCPSISSSGLSLPQGERRDHDAESLKKFEDRVLNPLINPVINQIQAVRDGKPLILVTCHRRENFGGILEGICELLAQLCKRYEAYHWVFPVHLNPNVREPVNRILGGIHNLTLIEPVNYLTNLFLLSEAVLVVTDSGGIQEEAPSFGVPVVVMRSHTERMEGVDGGFATLAGQNPVLIEKAIIDWLENEKGRAALKNKKNPYGDGLASKRIVSRLCNKSMEEFYG